VDTITRAHARAQRRWHTMLVAACYGDPNDRRTRLVWEAERTLDRLVDSAPEATLDAAHEYVIAEMDALAEMDLAIFLPDVPMAYVPELEARAMWGDR
jgi:hypothetical protein